MVLVYVTLSAAMTAWALVLGAALSGRSWKETFLVALVATMCLIVLLVVRMVWWRERSSAAEGDLAAGVVGAMSSDAGHDHGHSTGHDGGHSGGHGGGFDGGGHVHS